MRVEVDVPCVIVSRAAVWEGGDEYLMLQISRLLDIMDEAREDGAILPEIIGWSFTDTGDDFLTIYLEPLGDAL